ncbi:MAG: hypothetical protein GX575_14820 [Candidatus Anammoximicrobium sp.]|mgnify:CR=1 FL=1|nr:hypothetical protein [Candidatus Anammoximicrobium sp.]
MKEFRPAEISNRHDQGAAASPPADLEQWLRRTVETAFEGAPEGLPAMPAVSQDPAFRACCQQAGRQAWSIAQLRQRREEAGFQPLPVLELLQSLAGGAVAVLDGALAGAGLRESPPDSPGFAARWSALAHRLCLGTREALVALRLTHAVQADPELLSVFYARARGDELSGWREDQVDGLLRDRLLRWDADRRARLAAAEEAFSAGA